MLRAFLFFMLLSADAFAQNKTETLQVAAYEIAHILQKDGNGLYNEVITKIAQRSGVNIELNIFPAARANSLYRKSIYDCIVPMDVFIENDFLEDYRSSPINVAKAFIFTAEGSEVLNEISDLENLSVGIENGVPYPKKIKDKIGIYKTLAIKNLVKMVDGGRLDAFIAYVPDIYEFFAGEGREYLPHDPQKPIVRYNDSIVCKPTPRNCRLLKKVNQTIFAMYNSGELIDGYKGQKQFLSCDAD